MLNTFSIIGYLFLLCYTFSILKKNKDEFLAEDQTEDQLGIGSKWITLAGLLTAITVILHAAPVFLPVIGLALSPLSSVPVIIGTLLFKDRILPMFLAATALLFLINVQEAIIFLLATGPLGLSATLVAVPTISIWQKSLVPTSLLTCGILLLIFLVGLPGLQNIVSSLNITILLAIILFGFLYSSLFMGIALFVQKRMSSVFAQKCVDIDDDDDDES
ncbi:MAG TPA: hypothetical protein VFD17_06135 [Clostridia bacterium]|nr:hypothetical protein [Clostridia bacterium]